MKVYGLALLVLFIQSIFADQSGAVDDVGDDADHAMLISVNTLYSFVLTYRAGSGDVDYWKVYLLAGRTYKICSQASKTMAIFLRGPDKTTIIDFDHDVINPKIQYTPTSSNYYYFCFSQGAAAGTNSYSYYMYVGDLSSCSASCGDCKTVNAGCGACTAVSTCSDCSNGGDSAIIGAYCPCPSTTTVYSGGSCPTCASQISSCSTCSSTTVCTSCSGKYLYQGGCVSPCPENITYVSGSTCQSCSVMDTDCKTCNSSLTCTGCNSPKLALGSTCVDECIDGTFDLYGICTSCRTIDNSCERCNGTDYCTQCTFPLVALGSTCQSSCPGDTYDRTGICTSCATLDSSCTSCNSTVSCLGCSGGLVALGSACIDSCPTGTYNSNGLCVSCMTLDDPCQQCSNNFFCSVCDNGYIISGPLCVNPCPAGTIDSEGICSSTANQILIFATAATNSYLVQYSPALVYDIDVPLMTEVILQDVDPSAYSYILTKVSTAMYLIVFDNTVDIPAATLKLTYTLTRTLPTANTLTGRWFGTIETGYMSYLSSVNKAIINYINTIASTTSKVAAISAVSMTVLGANPVLVWPLLNLFQAFYYLIFINVNYPGNVQMFLKIFSIGALDFIPNPLQWFVHDIDDYSLPAPKRFQEYDVDALFLNNGGNELLFLTSVIGTYLGAKMIKKWIRSVPLNVRNLTNNMVGWFEWSGIISSLTASYTDFVLAIFLQMRVLTYDSYVYTISSVLAFVTLGFAVIIPIYAFVILSKYGNSHEALNEKYEALAGEYNIKKIAGRYFVPIWLIRRFLMCFSLVYLQVYPHLQISVLCVLMLISIVHTLGFSPYSSRKDNIVNTITEILFGMIHVAIYVLLYDDHKRNLSDAQRLNIGWVIIGLCGTILIMSLVLNLIEQIKELKTRLKELKQLLCPQRAKKNIKTHPGDSKQAENYYLPETFSQQNLHTRTSSEQSQLFDASRTRLDSSADTLGSPDIRINPRRIVQKKKMKNSMDISGSVEATMNRRHTSFMNDNSINAVRSPQTRINRGHMMNRSGLDNSVDTLGTPEIRSHPRRIVQKKKREHQETRVHPINGPRLDSSIDTVEIGSPETRSNRGHSVSRIRRLRKAQLAERINELRKINS